MNWIAIADRMPESGVKVLLYYKNALGKDRRILARWIPKFTEEANGETSDDLECDYNETANTYYWPEGWYEQIDNWDDYTSVIVHQGPPTHWMPLPASPC